MTLTPNIPHISINCKNHNIVDVIGFPEEGGMKWSLAQIWERVQGGDRREQAQRKL